VTDTVVVDARMLAYPMTGIGRYALELLTQLVGDGGQEWVLLSSAPVPAGVRDRLRGNVGWVEGDGHGRAEYWTQRASRRELQRRPGAAYLGLANSLPFLGPRAARYWLVVYDLSFVAIPYLTDRQDLVKGYLVTLPAILKADRLLAISPSIEAQLHRWFPWTRRRTAALPPGGTKLVTRPEPLPFERRSGFLMVGAHRRKNGGLLLDAYAALAPETRARHPLFVIARSIPEMIGRRARALGVERNLRLCPDASDAELERLYGECLALVYPSVYEGLGLPVAEALLAGLPAIVPGESPMTRFLGGCGIVVWPLRVPALAAAMERLATDARAWRACSVAARDAGRAIGWEQVGEAARRALGLE